MLKRYVHFHGNIAVLDFICVVLRWECGYYALCDSIVENMGVSIVQLYIWVVVKRC